MTFDQSAADNGFESAAVMGWAHRPVVALAVKALEGRAGNVLDLGCGNGVLLKKILSSNSGVTVFGIDSDSDRITRARKIFPGHADNFWVGDFFERDLIWSDHRRYSLGIVGLRRFLDVNSHQSAYLLAELTANCDKVLAYFYGRGWIHWRGGFRDLVERAGLNFASPCYATNHLAAAVLGSCCELRSKTGQPPSMVLGCANLKVANKGAK